MTAAKIVTEKVPDALKDKTNTVKNRILFLAPSVVSGEEHEACKEDFESLSNSNIGVGGFGRVFKVKHKKNGKIYAIKVVDKAKVMESNLADQMKLEVRIMYSLNHPHIIKLYNHFEDEDSFYLVMEYAAKGQLYTKLKLMGRLDERLTAQYIRELVSAIEYLHSLNPPIIHRDIKPENILLDEDESTKLCDFGWSNFNNSQKKRTTYCGTQEYLAPEMIKQSGHDETLDHWGIGVLMFELLTGRPPFEGATQGELFDNIVKVRINFPKDFSKLAKDLVCRLLKSDPRERIRGKELADHAWFKANPPFKKSTVGVVHKFSSAHEDVKSGKRNGMLSETDSMLSGGEKKKDDKDAVIDKLNNRYQEATKELTELKTTYQEKCKLLETLKKENQEINEHLGKLGKEFTPQAGQEIKRLGEELQKLKMLNKNREEMVGELDKKNALVAEYDSKIKMTQDQLEAEKREKESLAAKAAELQDKAEALEKKYETQKLAHEELKKAKESKVAELESRLELLQMQLISKTEDDGDNNNIETMMDVVKTILEEIRDKTFSQSNSKKEAETLRQELVFTYNKVAELGTKHDNDIFELQTQQNKKLEDLKVQLEAGTKSFEKKEELKVESLQKQLAEEEKNVNRISVVAGPNTAETYEKLKTGIEGLRSQNESRAHEIAELKAQIKAINAKIEETEYQYGLLKAEMLTNEELEETRDGESTRGSLN